MERIIKYWWVYTLLCLLFIGVITVDSVKDFLPGWYDSIPFIGVLLTAAAQLVAWICALLKKKTLLAHSIFMGGFVCIIGLFFLSFILLATAGMNDDFGKQHPIPPDMSCELPGDEFNYSGVDSLDASSWLSVCEGFQWGRYKYRCYLPPLPDGYVYLKCFEATENIPLSTESVFESTKTMVQSHTSFGTIGGMMGKDFTIYEGSWNDYYAVRVELWYHNGQSGEERLLTQKIYKMQGWQR